MTVGLSLRKRLGREMSHALASLRAEGVLQEVPASLVLERCRDERHGHFASTLALVLGRSAGAVPRELAARIAALMRDSALLAGADVAGPGFINFRVRASVLQSIVVDVLTEGRLYGHSDYGAGARLQVEFVSANPTGPLHIGHGRGAAYGAALANLLSAVGYAVEREYYVNDAGRQMDILAVSVWLRYLENYGWNGAFPANGYRGAYVRDIAASLARAEGGRFAAPGTIKAIPVIGSTSDIEAEIDALIALARAQLGASLYRELHEFGCKAILDDIRQDLSAFGVEYDTWFSERSLDDAGLVDRALAQLETAGHLYSSEGATWFRSTAFGDEKDRVVVRENGLKTYFASDIAYHMNKFERGYAAVIDVWGADHHGYIPRVRAALTAAGVDASRLDVQLIQFATLYRNGERVQMSTRSGEFVTLAELREEVGSDAARFFYVLRKSDQHLDFDLDLAKSQSNDNPVYYIQYAHARVCSIFRQLAESGRTWDKEEALPCLTELASVEEELMLAELAHYPEVLESAAIGREPHLLAHYLRELANRFHGYYAQQKFLVDDERARNARLALASAVRQVLSNGLALLGVSAPEQM